MAMGLTGHRSALDLMPVVREGCVNSKENMFRFGRNAMPRVAKTGARAPTAPRAAPSIR
jgi:hypothetical protein